jgi:hypothetical protein
LHGKYRKSGKKRTIIIDRSRQCLGFEDVAAEDTMRLKNILFISRKCDECIKYSGV